MGIFDIFGTGDQQAAAQSQINGINQGYGQLSGLYGQGQTALNQNYTAGLQPYLQNYGSASAGQTALGNALGLNGASGNAQATQAFLNNPGTQFQLQRGDNSINAAAAANGTLNSGNQLTALSNYNQGLASTNYNNYVNQLQPYLGAANSAASGIGSLYSNLGNQLNNSFMGQGNAAYGAQTSIGNANANANLAGLNQSANILNAGMSLGSDLFGFLSDAKAKDDIEPVGKLYDGQTVWRYRYKGDPRHQIGLIAQEVEEAAPDAVFDMTPDYKGVDYKTATDYAARLAHFSDSEPANSNYASDLLKMVA